jgi:hypothetical protein
MFIESAWSSHFFRKEQMLSISRFPETVGGNAKLKTSRRPAAMNQFIRETSEGLLKQSRSS